MTAGLCVSAGEGREERRGEEGLLVPSPPVPNVSVSARGRGGVFPRGPCVGVRDTRGLAGAGEVAAGTGDALCERV